MLLIIHSVINKHLTSFATLKSCIYVRLT